ncbi:hypothetical protein PsorP6_003737 [Peronosclerospora sorghi]|uniref:Uncharacterized protein n=1 Tax=Peronosclerospora sorghi TaxID=230839 RepID=A0ACC0VMM2_9STRA|nr:hypothetical protein PsorP6_003737 [Peronosclerospora sorghi]
MLQSRVATKRSREPAVEQNNANYEGVQIDEGPCAGAQIEEKLLQLLNCASEQMGDYMPATFRYDDGYLGSNSKTPHTGPDGSHSQGTDVENVFLESMAAILGPVAGTDNGSISLIQQEGVDSRIASALDTVERSTVDLGGSEAGIHEASVISAAGVIVRHMDIRHGSNPNLLLRNYPRRNLERFIYPDLDALRSGSDLFLLAKGCLTEVKARLPGEKGAIDGQTKARSLQARWFSSGSIGVIDNECENAPLEEGASSEVGAGLERNQVVVIDADSSDFFYRVLSVFRKSYNKWRICGSAPADGQTIIFAARVEKQPQLMRGLRYVSPTMLQASDFVIVKGNEVLIVRRES